MEDESHRLTADEPNTLGWSLASPEHCPTDTKGLCAYLYAPDHDSSPDHESVSGEESESSYTVVRTPPSSTEGEEEITCSNLPADPLARPCVHRNIAPGAKIEPRYCFCSQCFEDCRICVGIDLQQRLWSARGSWDFTAALLCGEDYAPFESH
ncbi:hypothetical protein BDW74DRAFT_172623 [Aspergillus multicolor]|uniref:uncharacterized protein n=1 Tax=Aspergillus multicolor TaxID=41759 RepID=UPI003CCC9E33